MQVYRNMESNSLQHTATHCNTLQHTATRCNILQHTTTHCNTLQHAVSHCITLQRTATHCITLQHTATHCSTLQHSGHVTFSRSPTSARIQSRKGLRNTLQRTARHCNTQQLQHTETVWAGNLFEGANFGKDQIKEGPAQQIQKKNRQTKRLKLTTIGRKESESEMDKIALCTCTNCRQPKCGL